MIKKQIVHSGGLKKKFPSCNIEFLRFDRVNRYDIDDKTF